MSPRAYMCRMYRLERLGSTPRAIVCWRYDIVPFARERNGSHVHAVFPLVAVEFKQGPGHEICITNRKCIVVLTKHLTYIRCSHEIQMIGDRETGVFASRDSDCFSHV
jgi:hypothetical protein